MLIPLVRFFNLINYLYSLVKAGQLPCPAFPFWKKQTGSGQYICNADSHTNPVTNLQLKQEVAIMRDHYNDMDNSRNCHTSDSVDSEKDSTRNTSRDSGQNSSRNSGQNKAQNSSRNKAYNSSRNNMDNSSRN